MSNSSHMHQEVDFVGDNIEGYQYIIIIRPHLLRLNSITVQRVVKFQPQHMSAGLTQSWIRFEKLPSITTPVVWIFLLLSQEDLIARAATIQRTLSIVNQTQALAHQSRTSAQHCQSATLLTNQGTHHEKCQPICVFP